MDKNQQWFHIYMKDWSGNFPHRLREPKLPYLFLTSQKHEELQIGKMLLMSFQKEQCDLRVHVNSSIPKLHGCFEMSGFTALHWMQFVSWHAHVWSIRNAWVSLQLGLHSSGSLNIQIVWFVQLLRERKELFMLLFFLPIHFTQSSALGHGTGLVS